MLRLLSLLSLLSAALLPAQRIELTPAYPTVRSGNDVLELAWTGGLNTPQPATTDLDGDGTDDLYVFDKGGTVHLGLRGDGAGGYEEAPELTEFFPPATGWVVLRDYNEDGAADLFVHGDLVDGIRVYRGRRRADGRLAFSLVDFGEVEPLLYFSFSGSRSSIFVSSVDYPAIDDVDQDGDLDILTFSVNGGYVDYFQNQSVERGFGTDTLIFRLVDRCWGGFFESGLTTALDLAAGPGQCRGKSTTRTGGGRPRHSGSTVTTLDYNGDGLTDIMLGDVSFDFLVLGLNGGSRQEAWINAQDTTWNTDGTVAVIRSFPAAFHLDIDQDGARDLLAAPSTTRNGDDVNVLWYYRNFGSDAAPDFRFVRRNHLVGEMIDLGTAANVAVFDYDADGRPDLVLGNNDEYFPGSNQLDSRLRLFRNVTPDGGEIAFELIDEDYLELSRFRASGWAFAPVFGDLDDDGDADVIIGDRSGQLFFGENTAGAGRAATFPRLEFQYADIDVGQFAKPHLADLDRDGLIDLLVGGFDGRIRFYRNVGSATQPLFSGSTEAPGNSLQLGGINTSVPAVRTGHPSPWVVQNANYTLLISGNRNGEVQAYRFGVDTSYLDDFTQLTGQLGGLDVGGFSNPGFGDFDGDGVLEMVLGTERGGVLFYRTNLKPDATVPVRREPLADYDFSVYPNPAAEVVTVTGWPAGAVERAELIDVRGRVVHSAVVRAGTRVQWPVTELGGGVYVVRLTGSRGTAVQKVVVR